MFPTKHQFILKFYWMNCNMALQILSATFVIGGQQLMHQPLKSSLTLLVKTAYR